MKEYTRGMIDGMLKMLREFDEFTEVTVRVTDGETVMERIVREVKTEVLGEVKDWMIDEIREKTVPKEGMKNG